MKIYSTSPIRTICRVALSFAAFFAISIVYAADYVWNAGDATYSKDAANWLVGGETPSADFTYGSDTAVFNSTCSLTINSDFCNIKNARIAEGATVTLVKGTSSRLVLTGGTISGGGTLALDDSTFYLHTDSSTTISCGLKVGSNGGMLKTKNNRTLTVSGAISGSGVLTIAEAVASHESFTNAVSITGDVSAFTGTGVIKVESSNSGDTIYSRHNFAPSGDTVDASNSRWEIYMSTTPRAFWLAGDSNQFPFHTSNATYKFKSLAANLPDVVENGAISGITLELSEGSYLGGSWGGVTGNKITWNGSSTQVLTNDCANTATIEVTASGTVAIPSSSGVPATLTFTNGGAVIVGSKTVYDAVSTLVEGQSGVTITYGGEVTLSASDISGSISVTDGATINYIHDYTIEKGSALFSVSSENADKITVNILSPNTKAASRFFTAMTSDNSIVAAYVTGAYVWTNGGEGTDFTTPGNWEVNGETASSAPNGSDKIVIFPKSDTALSTKKGDKAIGHMYLGRDVTFTGGTSHRVLIQNTSTTGTGVVEGPGTLTLSGGTRLMTANYDSDVYCDVAISGNTSTLFSSQGSKTMRLHGKLIGDENSSISIGFNDKASDSTRIGYVCILGDCSEFLGAMATTFDADNPGALSFDCGTEGGSMLFGGSLTLGDAGNSSVLCATAGTYAFASLSGKVTSSSDAVTLVTKASSATTINNVTASNAWTLKNAGTGNVTVETNNFATNVTSSTGAFVLPSFNGAVVVKEGNAANAKYAAVKAGSNVDLTGLTLALEVPDEVGGWQNLVEATSYLGEATSLVTFTKPEGREKYILKMRSATILGATDRTGFTIVIQ